MSDMHPSDASNFDPAESVPSHLAEYEENGHHAHVTSPDGARAVDEIQKPIDRLSLLANALGNTSQDAHPHEMPKVEMERAARLLTARQERNQRTQEESDRLNRTHTTSHQLDEAERLTQRAREEADHGTRTPDMNETLSALNRAISDVLHDRSGDAFVGQAEGSETARAEAMRSTLVELSSAVQALGATVNTVKDDASLGFPHPSTDYVGEIDAVAHALAKLRHHDSEDF